MTQVAYYHGTREQWERIMPQARSWPPEWAEWINTAYPIVYGLLRNKGFPHDVAEDATQEAVKKVLEKNPPYIDSQKKMTGWLCTTAYREALALQRRNGRIRPIADGIDPPSPQDGPPAEFIRKELTIAVRECLDRLPDEQRTLCWLKHVEDLTYKEIANKYGWSEATAWRAVRDATAALRRLMLAAGLGPEAWPW